MADWLSTWIIQFIISVVYLAYTEKRGLWPFVWTPSSVHRASKQAGRQAVNQTVSQAHTERVSTFTSLVYSFHDCINIYILKVNDIWWIQNFGALHSQPNTCSLYASHSRCCSLPYIATRPPSTLNSGGAWGVTIHSLFLVCCHSLGLLRRSHWACESALHIESYSLRRRW